MPRASRSATAKANGLVPKVAPPTKTKAKETKAKGKAPKATEAPKTVDLEETANDLKPLDSKHKLAKV